MNVIQWKRKAQKQLSKLPKERQLEIFRKISALKVSVEKTPNLKKMQGLSTYRLRVGRYRVMFEYAQEIRIVTIEEVKKRDERTY